MAMYLVSLALAMCFRWFKRLLVEIYYLPRYIYSSMRIYYRNSWGGRVVVAPKQQPRLFPVLIKSKQDAELYYEIYNEGESLGYLTIDTIKTLAMRYKGQTPTKEVDLNVMVKGDSTLECMIHNRILTKSQTRPDHCVLFYNEEGLPMGTGMRIHDYIVTAYHVAEEATQWGIPSSAVSFTTKDFKRLGGFDLAYRLYTGNEFSTLGISKIKTITAVPEGAFVEVNGYSPADGAWMCSSGNVNKELPNFQVGYLASTKSGMSGAPVTHGKGRVVGIHIEKAADLSHNIFLSLTVFSNFIKIMESLGQIKDISFLDDNKESYVKDNVLHKSANDAMTQKAKRVFELTHRDGPQFGDLRRDRIFDMEDMGFDVDPDVVTLYMTGQEIDFSRVRNGAKIRKLLYTDFLESHNYNKDEDYHGKFSRVSATQDFHSSSCLSQTATAELGDKSGITRSTPQSRTLNEDVIAAKVASSLRELFSGLSILGTVPRTEAFPSQYVSLTPMGMGSSIDVSRGSSPALSEITPIHPLAKNSKHIQSTSAEVESPPSMKKRSKRQRKKSQPSEVKLSSAGQQ
jgi:hypothetical protein